MRKSWIIGAASAAALGALGVAAPAFAQTESADPDQPNDASTRARIAPGQSVSGRLDPAGDADWFRIRLRAGRGYAIALAGEGDDNALGDPLVRLLDADGEEIAVNDDGPGGLDSLLIHSPERSGNYYIEARGFSDEAAGAYRLSVEERELPPDHASASTRTRARIAPGESVRESLAPAGDKDWHRIELEAGQTYRFSLVSDGDASASLFDPFLRVLNAEGEEAASNDDGGDGFNSYLEFTPTAGGSYFVEAGAFGDGGEGAYVLSAAAGGIPADTSTDATLGAGGEYREGVLAPPGDADWYRLELEAGQTVTISLAGGGAEALSDPYLVVYGPDGAQAAFDDDGGEGLNSKLEFTAAAGGAHFVEARGFGEEAQGTYLLSLTPGEIGADADSAEGLSAGSESASRISPGGDQDWYAVELTEGRPYRFSLKAVGETALDPVLTLYGGDGETVIASDDDGGAGDNAYLTFTPLASGRYIAAVAGQEATDAGGYTLRVSDTETPGDTDSDDWMDAAAGDARASVVNMPGDRDFFGVDLEAGASYVITLAGVGDHPLDDAFLAVRSASGEELASDDDGGPGLDSRLVFTPSEAGRYFLQASGVSNSVGQYSLAIARRER